MGCEVFTEEQLQLLIAQSVNQNRDLRVAVATQAMAWIGFRGDPWNMERIPKLRR